MADALATTGGKHSKGKGGSEELKLGSAPSRGNPRSTSALNTELNNVHVARNTNDTAKARALVAAGADLASTNGGGWQHTPLHQAAYHGRYEMAACLVELGAPLHLHSNPCGRGSTGTPEELARGGGHEQIAQMLNEAAAGGQGRAAGKAAEATETAAAEIGLGVTTSHGNPRSTSALNTELINVARSTNDTAKAHALVAAGADLASTNGGG